MKSGKLLFRNDVSFFLFRPSGPSKALKLGAKGKEVDNFVDKLKSEGETIMPTSGKRGSDVSKALPPPVNVERYMHIIIYHFIIFPVELWVFIKA